MKKLAAVCLLMFALSFPAFAGHTVQGEHYCGCGTIGCIEDYPCECCTKPVGTDNAPNGATAEWGIALVAILFWLRLKA